MPYSYFWSNGDTTDSTGNLTAGTYTVIVTDSLACNVTGSVTIIEPDSITITYTIDTANQGNNNGAIYLTVTGGTQPYTFSWSNGDTTEDLDSILAGTYIVLVTDSLGCIDSASIEIPEITGIKQSSLINTELKIYPNPFSDITTIKFSLPETENIYIGIFNITGGEITVLFNGKADKDEVYNLEFDAANLLGGIYFIRLETATIIYNKKLVVIK